MKEMLFGFLEIVEKIFMFMFGFIWKFVCIALGFLFIMAIFGICQGEMVGTSIGMLVFCLLLLIGGEVLLEGYKSKCPHCKKRFGLVKISEEITRTEDISVLTEVKNRNKNGEVIGTTEQYIPGTRTFYRETYKCKGCGEISYGTYSKDRKNL